MEMKKKKICIYSLQPGHLEAEPNYRNIKRRNIKKKGVRKRENSKYKHLLSLKIITGPRQNGQG